MSKTENKTENLSKNSFIDANYSEQIISDYQGNPLIEALYPIFDEEYVFDSLSVFPEINDKERELSPNYRFHCVQRLSQYFQPFQSHLDLEQRISRAIRQGYLHRNPFNQREIQKVRESYQAIKRGDFSKPVYQVRTQSGALGFTVIGFSGIGKTKAIERILLMYPQIIKHTQYQEVPFIFTQVCWLKLDCPFDGSLKGLCISFFAALDKLLGTDYLYKFGSSRNTTDLMLQRIAHLSSFHGIGLLVIDEIQHLNLSKNGGSEKMLNFFVTLVNTIGVPVILVGTNKAASVLQSEFRQARRGSGQGDMVWPQMPKDETWELVIGGMWEYQWINHYTELTQELSDHIYNISQGILDIAIKLFMLSQVRAIAMGVEKLNKKIISDVEKDNLKLVKPMLDALRSGIPSKIAQYEDLRPIDMDEEIEKYKASVNMQERIRIQKLAQQAKSKKKYQSLTEEIVLKLLSMDFKESVKYLV